MKIAFLTPEYPNPRAKISGGIGTSIKNLALELAKTGIAITIIVHGQQEDEQFLEDGISFYFLKNVGIDKISWYLTRKKIQRLINHLHRNGEIDLVEAPDWNGITSFINTRCPIILRLHGSDTYFCQLEGRPQKRKNYIWEKLAMQAADGFVSPTDFTADLTARLFKLDRKKIITIPNGISLDKFTNQHPRDFERGLIVYIGTLIQKKGVFELPGIMKHVLEGDPEARLLLIGQDSYDTGSETSSTWKLIENQLEGALKTRVTYLGKVPYAEVEAYIKKAHVCVFPTFAETQGMVTIEAMAMQKPIVSSNFGWVSEMLEQGKSGFMVNPLDHKGFSGRILEIFRDENLYNTMGTNAREKVFQKFDIRKIAQENILFYESVLKMKRR